MNGKGKTLLLVISLAFNLGACLAVAVQVRAAQEARPQHRERGKHRERLIGMLNLSAEQTEVLSVSRDQLFEDLRTLMRQVREESLVLADLITVPEIDMDAVTRQADAVAAVRNEIQRRMLEHLLGVREMLEPDQLEAFKEFASKVLSHSGRHGRHKGRSSKECGEGPEGQRP
jgi:Spy/CpxP family protein refolding chaperone